MADTDHRLFFALAACAKSDAILPTQIYFLSRERIYMNIWSTREQSLAWLGNELLQESKVVQEGFDHLGMFVELFQHIGDKEGESQVGQFCRICIVTLAKFNRLILGCYSLMLDALAQESGALLRPLIETYELLVYFRQDISRINELLEDRLPSAGVIGKRITGDYQNLREHLNDNASHFSYKIGSVQPLFSEDAKIKLMPTPNLEVLRINLQLLNTFQVFVLIESVNCLFAIGYDANSRADEIEKWRDNCVKMFMLEK